MTETGTPFKHSTPELYDRYMGPLLFEPFAKLVGQRAALLQPDRIRETAAGTGIVTRALHLAVPRAQIVATDVNPVMLDVAAQRLGSDRVSFQPADAQDLPFDDESFDLVVCQFGVMFFPEKVRANEEARRVLRAGGHYLLVSFDRLEFNPVPKAAGNVVAELFPDDPPAYMERGPFSYVDPAFIEHDLLAAGFTKISWRRSPSQAVAARATPLRGWCSARPSAQKSSGATRLLLIGPSTPSQRHWPGGTATRHQCRRTS
jgi:ubiquinone/menaquinone biosynthesis C-methylase UbiE